MESYWVNYLGHGCRGTFWLSRSCLRRVMFGSEGDGLEQ